MSYAGGDAARGFFEGFRTVSVFISDSCVAEISVVGETVEAQQASLQLMAESMQGGYNTLVGNITDVLDIESLGWRADDPEIASTLIDTLFAECDTLTYEAAEFAAAAAGRDTLLAALEEAGEALLAFLAL